MKTNTQQNHADYDHDHHEHAHNHLGGHHHHSSGSQNLWIAFTLNFVFAIIEFIGGMWTGSTAILSDALHDLGDSFALAISAILQQISRKQAPEKYNFGWKRLPIIGAIVNILILIVSVVFIVSEAIPQLLNPTPVYSTGMIWIAILGIVANGIAVFRIYGSKRILDRTVMLHLLEDLLGWIAVLVVAIVLVFTDWYWLDPLLSLGIAGIMAKNIFEQLKIVFVIILGATIDEPFKQELVAHIFQLTPEIIEIPKFQLWSLDGDESVACLKVRLATPDRHEIITQQIHDYLATEEIHEVTIECEFANKYD